MNRKANHPLHLFSGVTITVLLVFGAIFAQQPTPSPSPQKPAAASAEPTPIEAGEGYGAYTVISTIELGYRGLAVDGDLNKYRSDLNYKPGPRLFDSSFLMRSKDGSGGWFETMLVTSSGWGGDPNGQIRINIEEPKWYRFDAHYRTFKYFRFVNNLANPNWTFTPPVPPNPVTGEHGYDTNTKIGDLDLTLFPKDRRIRFSVGYSPERYTGPAFTNYHVGGNDFNYPLQLRSRANDFRFGAEGQVGRIDYTFLQGFRRFRDDSFLNLGPTPGINRASSASTLTSFTHDEPARGSINFTRGSLHTLVANKLDITANVVYSSSDSDSTFLEKFTGRNWNARVSGWPPGPLAQTPNTLNLGLYNIVANTRRPYWLGDIGATFLATKKLRISNTFRVEDFKIYGDALFSDFFSITRGSGASTVTDTIAFNNLDAHRTTKYRKYQDTVEGDYQFNARYSVHLGYRYGHRRVEDDFEGYNLGSNGSVPPPSRSSSSDTDQNNTHVILGGFKARPAGNWTVYFDAEHGTADNVFSRIGNYDYTNIRAKSRYAPNKRLTFNLAFISRDNSNPSEIAGVSLQDFGAEIKSRIFTSSVDWNPNPRFSVSGGYNYNWINSDSVINYFYNSVNHPQGHSLYFARNNFFFVDTTVLITPRLSFYSSYRINQDSGQGSRVEDPIGNPGTLVASYPMSFQSPEARLSYRFNRRLDWNVGYQYYNYNENAVVGPRPQNYHAHLPYTSLRLYFGRKE